MHQRPERLATLLPAENADACLRGPVSCMVDIQYGLEEHGVAAQDIHIERIG